jgi:hypothetical protein
MRLTCRPFFALLAAASVSATWPPSPNALSALGSLHAGLHSVEGGRGNLKARTLHTAFLVWRKGWQEGSQAQQGPNKKIIDVQFQDLDIREALKQLFKKVGAFYDVDEKVAGTVTISVRNVTFEAALQNTLKQVNATWREKDGRYQIVLKPTDEPYVQVVDPKAPVDARLAIWRLFKNFDVPVFISPDVKGSVVLEPRNITFEASLNHLLKQANATYRVQGGVYQIVPSPRLKVGGGPEPFLFKTAIQEASITVDGRFLFVLLEGTFYKLNKSDLKTVAQSSVSFQLSPASAMRVDVDEKQVDVRDAIRHLFAKTDISYSIGVDVQGTVTLKAKGILFDEALFKLISAVGAVFEVEGGVYLVHMKRANPEESVENQQAKPVIAQDETFLYVVQGRVVTKVAKSSLAKVGQRKLGD